MNELTTSGVFSLAPRNLDEAFRLADILADSSLVPKDYQGKPANILVAVQWGAEVGLKPLQALQNIAVINGRPALWGDAVIALARSHPACEYITEEDDGTTAICRAKRRGEPEQVRTFSADDARTAGLSGKSGPWTQYPKRMRQMRARGFALRDVFADALKGLPIAEELQDMPAETPEARPAPRHMGDLKPVQAEPTALPAPDLVARAEEAALLGVTALQDFWRTLPKADKLALQPSMASLKVAAAEADAARAPTDGAVDPETGEVQP